MSKKRKSRKLKKVHISPEVTGELKGLREAFKNRFGRDSGPNDPVFFDDDYHVPVPLDPGKVEQNIVDKIMALGLANDREEALEIWRNTVNSGVLREALGIKKR